MGPTFSTIPYFLLCYYFTLLFLENALLSLLFTLKYHLGDKNTENFPRCLEFSKLSINFNWLSGFKGEDVCYAFLRVCLYVPCGHLLGKG